MAEAEEQKSFQDIGASEQLAEIGAASKYSSVDTLKQQYRLVPAEYKDCYLVYILTEMSGSTSMVFTRTCNATLLLAYILHNLGIRAIPINGLMAQSKRLVALNKFKAGECNIIICTDGASRGLDIPFVDMVINYDIPTNPKKIKTIINGGDGEEDIDKYLGLNKGKSSNKVAEELPANSCLIFICSFLYSLFQGLRKKFAVKF